MMTLLAKPIANCFPQTHAQLLQKACRGKVQRRDADQIAAENTDGTAIQVEQRHHGDQCGDSRQDKEVINRNSKRLEGVDLLVALHCGKVRGVRAAGPPAITMAVMIAAISVPCRYRQIGYINSGAETPELYGTNECDDRADQPVHDGDNPKSAPAPASRTCCRNIRVLRVRAL